MSKGPQATTPAAFSLGRLNIHPVVEQNVLAGYTVIREAWRDDWTGKGLRLAHGTSQQLPRVFVRWVRSWSDLVGLPEDTAQGLVAELQVRAPGDDVTV